MSWIRYLWPDFTEDRLPTPWTIDDKISVFCHQVDGWQLDIANRLINGIPTIPGAGDAGFAVLLIVSSYFEMRGLYKEGALPKLDQHGKLRHPGSGEHFAKGILLVFPHLKVNKSRSQIPVLYSDLRCALYHSGRIAKHISISGDHKDALTLNGDIWCINPSLLVTALKLDLATYEAHLRNVAETDLRAKFEKRFDHDDF